jgi:hypothetical protein
MHPELYLRAWWHNQNLLRIERLAISLPLFLFKALQNCKPQNIDKPNDIYVLFGCCVVNLSA